MDSKYNINHYLEFRDYHYIDPYYKKPYYNGYDDYFTRQSKFLNENTREILDYYNGKAVMERLSNIENLSIYTRELNDNHWEIKIDINKQCTLKFAFEDYALYMVVYNTLDLDYLLYEKLNNQKIIEDIQKCVFEYVYEEFMNGLNSVQYLCRPEPYEFHMLTSTVCQLPISYLELNIFQRLEYLSNKFTKEFKHLLNNFINNRR
jgi:hypothetical protein